MLDSAIHAGQSHQVGFSPRLRSLVFEMQSHSYYPTANFERNTSRSGKVRNSEYVHVENDSRKVGNTGARVKTEGSREESEFRRDKQGQGALYAGGGKTDVGCIREITPSHKPNRRK